MKNLDDFYSIEGTIETISNNRGSVGYDEWKDEYEYFITTLSECEEEVCKSLLKKFSNIVIDYINELEEDEYIMEDDKDKINEIKKTFEENGTIDQTNLFALESFLEYNDNSPFNFAISLFENLFNVVDDDEWQVALGILADGIQKI